MLSAKQGNYWYHFYNVFGMTRSLTGDWTRDLSHSPVVNKCCCFIAVVLVIDGRGQVQAYSEINFKEDYCSYKWIWL